MIVRTIRLLNYYVVAALLLSSIVPVQAQTVRQRALRTGQAVRNFGSATVGGVRYGVDWVNRQIESVRLPVWAKRRIAATFKRFATPTEQEQAVIEKYIAGQRLNVTERQIWNQYKSRVYKSRGAIAVIVTVVLAILATIGGAVYLSRSDGDGAPDSVDPRLTTIVSEPSTLWEAPLEDAGYESSAAAPIIPPSELTTAQIDPETTTRYEEAERQERREQERLQRDALRRQAEAEQAAAEAARLAALPVPSGQTFDEWQAAQMQAGRARRQARQAVAPEPATIPLPEQTLEEQAELAELIESPEQTIARLRQKRESEGLNWAEQLMLEHSERQVAEAGAAGRRRPSRRVVEQAPLSMTASVLAAPLPAPVTGQVAGEELESQEDREYKQLLAQQQAILVDKQKQVDELERELQQLQSLESSPDKARIQARIAELAKVKQWNKNWRAAQAELRELRRELSSTSGDIERTEQNLEKVKKEANVQEMTLGYFKENWTTQRSETAAMSRRAAVVGASQLGNKSPQELLDDAREEAEQSYRDLGFSQLDQPAREQRQFSALSSSALGRAAERMMPREAISTGNGNDNDDDSEWDD